MDQAAHRYHFNLTCGDCGNKLEHIQDFGWSIIERKAIARCTNCKATWLIAVVMSRVSQRPQDAERARKYRAQKRTPATPH
jgi:DNA-directed RNA polymerase subunit RPC12/RpoP